MATEQTLFGGNGHKDDLSYEGVRVVDPTEGIDETLNLTVEAGVITKIEPGSGGDGRIVAPAFVDPHVHLRTPGREDEEDIASGTKAAAAGGYCAILAMPNTEPAVDSAAVLGALVERAKDEAEIPVGFFAAISKGQDGAELTEMVELAERGAAGFTDDAAPSRRPGSCAAPSSTTRSRAGALRSTARRRLSRAAATCTRDSCRRSSASGAIRQWPRA